MNIYSILMMIGGLAFFLFGMNVLSSGLKKVAGNRLENTLQKMTDHPLKGLMFGAIITIAMQSSSALTVMLVGLVNSGIMTLIQTVGVIMGSNIGTTLTAWILSLSGLKTDNIFLLLLKPENFSPILALLGVVLIMFVGGQRKKDIGFVMVGFAVLMHGMEMMSDALSPLAENPDFTSVLTLFKNPFFGVAIGLLFTAIIQSSAASVGVLQALSLTGNITYGVAVPIIMGLNIGTCVTAVLSTIGVNKNAKRVSVIHICFNLIGTAVGLLLYLLIDLIADPVIFDSVASPLAIALFHTIFNVGTTIILLPFTRQLVMIAEKIIRDDGKDVIFLDERLLLSPSLAAAECRRKSVEVLKLATDGFIRAMSLLGSYDTEKRDEIRDMEERVDEMVDSCNSFLIQLSSREVSEAESEMISELLHSLGDMERISDYSLNISTITKKMTQGESKQNARLSELIEPVNAEIGEIFSLVNNAYENKDPEIASQIIERSAVLVGEIKKMKKADMKKLRKGKGEAENSVYLSDYLSIARRVAEHSENIAETIV